MRNSFFALEGETATWQPLEPSKNASMMSLHALLSPLQLPKAISCSILNEIECRKRRWKEEIEKKEDDEINLGDLELLYG